MRYLVSRSRYLVLIGVFASLAAATVAFLWGGYKTVMVVYNMYEAVTGDPHSVRVELVAIMDVFLIATALFVFAVGLYKLFVGKVDLPRCLVINDLHDLKTILSRVVVLVMAVVFLEHLVSWKSASETLMFAGAIGIVMAALIAYGRLSVDPGRTPDADCGAAGTGTGPGEDGKAA